MSKLEVTAPKKHTPRFAELKIGDAFAYTKDDFGGEVWYGIKTGAKSWILTDVHGQLWTASAPCDAFGGRRMILKIYSTIEFKD